MNAKKIMGAVLVALLAAALFVGAGAAASQGTYFVYQEGVSPTGVWTNGAASVTITDGVIYPSDNFVAGTYKKGDDTISVSLPTATYALSAEVGGIPYLVGNGGTVYEGSEITLDVTPVAPVFDATGAFNYYVTYPNGTVANTTNNPWDTTTITDKGTYKVQAVFLASFNKLLDATPVDLLLDQKSFTFTVVGKDDVTISASTDKAFSGEAVTFTVVGTPGEKYNLTANGFNISKDQLLVVGQPSGYPDNVYNFTIPNSGKATFVAVVNKTAITTADKDVATLTLGAGTTTVKKGEVKITIAPPVVTATLGASSYFVGDAIKITGTSTTEVKDGSFTYYISGTNFKKTEFQNPADEVFGKNWEVSLPTANLVEENVGSKKLDVGTYTITIEQGGDVVKTLAVALKQPFLSITEAPEVIVKGTDAEFVVTAEATERIAYYIFGTNYFYTPYSYVQAADEDVPNQFEFKLGGESITDSMAPGQYFMVVQHPMYNEKFNIIASSGAFYMNTDPTNDATADPANLLFNVNDRQTANAAQALCDALDNQNIDDMYVKYSFFVVGEDEAFEISEIPTQVVQGEQIVISGTATANAGDVVQVEMISTAFAAVPKETVGSAAFIVVTTEVAKDGTWEITLDTSDLNVDEYSLSVAIDNTPQKNVKVNVVEGADKPVNPEQPEEPVNPEQPEEPVAPATPGFGALAALAGLGAVAVLLLRRE